MYHIVYEKDGTISHEASYALPNLDRLKALGAEAITLHETFELAAADMLARLGGKEEK